MKRLRLLAVLACLVPMACGGPEETPEARIRALIAEGEAAAEARDLGRVKDLVSERYEDGRGYDRQVILRIVQGTFLQNRNVHLLTLVRNLEINVDRASVQVLVAMTGRPVESAEALLNTRAELMRFDVELALEGDQWRVRAVEWRRAGVNDFL